MNAVWTEDRLSIPTCLKKAIYLTVFITMSFPNVSSSPQEQQNAEEVVSKLIDASTSKAMLESRLASRKSTIASKERYLTILKARLRKVQEVDLSETNHLRISRLAYSIFLVESRSITERMKLWQLQAMLSISSKTESSEKHETAANYLSQIPLQRSTAINKIKDLGNQYRPLITDENIRLQFDMSIKNLDTMGW